MNSTKTLIWLLTLIAGLLAGVVGLLLSQRSTTLQPATEIQAQAVKPSSRAALPPTKPIAEVQSLPALTKTKGKLLELRIVNNPADRGAGFFVIPHYTFLFKGRELTGHGMFGTTNAANPDSLKELIKPWMTKTFALKREHSNELGYEFSYSPADQTVPVYYDPVNPARSFFGIPSSASIP